MALSFRQMYPGSVVDHFSIRLTSSCLNLLFARSHQVVMRFNVKRRIQGRNNLTIMQMEPRTFDQGRHEIDAIIFSVTPPMQ